MIRLFQEKDIDAVMEIWLKTNISAHNFIPEKYWYGNFEAVKGQYLPKSDNYVYEEDGVIKAFICIMKESFIGALFVGEEYQKQGIGFQLIEFSKDSYDKLEVAVFVENTKAVEFYERCGFTIQKKQKNTDSKHYEYIMVWAE